MKIRYLVVIIIAVLLTGCSVFRKKPPELMQGSNAGVLRARASKIGMFRRQLDAVHVNIEEGDVDTAEINLKPMLELDLDKIGMGFMAEEIQLLKDSIDDARKLLDYRGRNMVDRRRMISEAEAVANLPGTYGTTVVIDSGLEPLSLPPGPMEELLNTKVSIALENAGISELVTALKETCKINTIADDAIKIAKHLSVSVSEVPLKEVLSYISRNMGVAFHLGENLLWVTKSEVQDGGPVMETRIIHLRQGGIPNVPTGDPKAPDAGQGDQDLQEALKAFMTSSPAGAAFRIFRDRNILVIRDTRENLRLAEKLVRELDKPPYQVVIEARFITVSQEDLKDLGAELNFTRQWHLDTTTDPALAKTLDMLSSFGALRRGAENGVGLMNFSGVLANKSFDILLSALDKKDSTVTLSAPKVTVMNNRQAQIRKGDTIYYFEEYDTMEIDRGDLGREKTLVPTGTPKQLPVGLTFNVKVNVGNDGRTVLLGLKPEIVEFKGWEEYISSRNSSTDANKKLNEPTQIKLPRTYEQSVSTTVSVSSGQTVVLGGMLENQKINTVRQVPFFGKLPLIGYLFRHEETRYTPTNLLMFITATVVNGNGEYVEVLPEKDGAEL